MCPGRGVVNAVIEAFGFEAIPFVERYPLWSIVAVRASAVTKRDGKDVVLVVQKDEKGAEKLVLRPVQVGAALGDLVQVGGVAAGAIIVNEVYYSSN